MPSLRPLIATALAMLCLTAAPAYVGGEGWTHDYEAAKTQAAEQGKDMLLDFTGSDWCGWCIKLVDEVFSKEDFKAYAGENLVLVELDFPRDKSKVSEATRAQNDMLKEQFGIRGYPSIYLTDSTGKPYAKTGYRRGGPKPYVEHLAELKQVRIERDKHMAAAKEAKGLDKAKHLYAAMQAVGDDLATQHYKSVVEEIKTLDADNKAGLKKHYDDIAVIKAGRAAIQKIMRSARNDPKGSITKLDEMIAKQGTLPQIVQDAYSLKAQIQLSLLKDKPAAKESVLKAIDANPDSEAAKQLKSVLDRVFNDKA